MRLLFSLFFLTILMSGCLVIDNRYEGLAPGYWRAELEIVPKERKAVPYDPRNRDGQIEREMIDLEDGILPFVFEVKNEADGTQYLEVINGKERIRVDNISFGTQRHDARDTVRIEFPLYESYITAKVEEKLINGFWVVKNRKNYKIPFTAKYGQNHRFSTLRKTPKADLSGKWSTMFGTDTDDPYPAIGEFEQDGNHIAGTFLTETGDFRFLEGTVQGNKVYLSCFDGSHAFLFTAKIMDDGSLVGGFRSGSHYKTTWEAKKDASASLISPDSLTYLLPGYSKFAFEFPNAESKLVNLEDEKYQGKVKIVQILGTWCPNCRDETEFLVDYLKNNPNDQLEVIALAFEKYRDFDKAAAAVQRYSDRFKMPYELLIAGYSDKSEASKALPMLNKVISYPTMIFLNRENEVVKIHTGFAGPATSAYPSFVKEFEEYIKKLTNGS